MKAKVKATGQVFELCPYVYDIDGNDFLLEEIELLDNPNWQQVRIQASIAAMNIVKGAYNIHNDVERLVHHSVRIADALIEELKKGGQDESDN